MPQCHWCPKIIYYKQLQGGGFSACEDKELTIVHVCPNRPRQGENPQQPQTAPTTKQVKIPPLTDREVLFLRKFVYFCEEFQSK